MMRVGIGYDSHRFAAGRSLILGGVHVPHTMGLRGHSDADAITHALIDALLGAAGLGDIGRLFPDTDPVHKDADSTVLLATVRDNLSDAGWRCQQADITVIAEAPKLAPHIAAMQTRLGLVLGVDATSISIKAKTNEGMGFIGRAEGIAVMAVATIVRSGEST